MHAATGIYRQILMDSDFAIIHDRTIPTYIDRYAPRFDVFSTRRTRRGAMVDAVLKRQRLTHRHREPIKSGRISVKDV